MVPRGLVLINALNGLGKGGRHGQRHDLVDVLFLGQGDGVEQDDLLNGAFLNTLNCGTRKNAVGGAGINLLCSAYLLNGLCGVAEGSGGVYHVVHENDVFILDVADYVHDLADVGALAALVHNGDGRVETAGEVSRSRDRAEIGDTTTMSSGLVPNLSTK